jgi:plasmid stabilization system protein ParE
MNYSFSLTSEAVQDLKEAYEWYDDKLAGLGKEFLTSVKATLNQVSRNPFLFPHVSEKRNYFRRAVIRKFSYLLFYRVENDHIYIIAVISSRRDPSIWKKRLH